MPSSVARTRSARPRARRRRPRRRGGGPWSGCSRGAGRCRRGGPSRRARRSGRARRRAGRRRSPRCLLRGRRRRGWSRRWPASLAAPWRGDGRTRPRRGWCRPDADEHPCTPVTGTHIPFPVWSGERGAASPIVLAWRGGGGGAASVRPAEVPTCRRPARTSRSSPPRGGGSRPTSSRRRASLGPPRWSSSPTTASGWTRRRLALAPGGLRGRPRPRRPGLRRQPHGIPCADAAVDRPSAPPQGALTTTGAGHSVLAPHLPLVRAWRSPPRRAEGPTPCHLRTAPALLCLDDVKAMFWAALDKKQAHGGRRRG